MSASHPLSRALLAIALACGVTVSAAESQPAPANAGDMGTIGGVRIEGTRRVHQDRIRFILTTRPGRRLDQQALADDVRAIEKMGPFTDTKCEIQRGDDGKVIVVFRVTELPYVANIEWEGLNYFKRTDAEKVVQTKAGGDCNQLILENDRRALERHFQDKGYRYVQVRIRQHDDHGAVDVTFAVDLGRDIQVGRVVYKGLPSKVPPKQVDQGLLNGPGQPYHAELMSLDQGSVIRTLQELGWLDAKLIATHCEQFDYVRPFEERRRHGPALVPDGLRNDSVVLTYEIDPGERYYLGSVSYVGNTVASSAELREAFRLEEGYPFKRVDIDKAIERSRRVIGNQGYAKCDIRDDRRLDPKEHRVHLTLHIDEGQRYKIGRVDVSGNYGTKDPVVRRAVMLKPGDLWNDDAVDESKRQIRRTDLFRDTPDRPLKIAPKFPEDRPNEADLAVNLEEQETGQISFQLGYSSSVGIFLEGGYTERNFDLLGTLSGQNFRGAGQILNVNASWSTQRTSAGISWTNQHVLDGPYFFTGAMRRTDSSIRDWREVRLTPSATIGRRFFNNDLLLSVSYLYTDLQIKQVYDNAPNDAFLSGDSFFMNTLGVSQVYDRLDSPRLPTRGYRVEANESFTGMPLPASYKYWEYVLQGNGFVPLFEGEQGGTTFFHLGATWRQIEPLDGSDYVPYFQRYFGGGPAPSHRGFGYSDLTPREINRNGRVARVGGTTDALTTGEIHIPIQDANDGLRFVLFADYGNVWGAGQTIDLATMRTAAGFGIRFPVQIPVALDFAWLLDAKDGEPKTQIQFTMGTYNF